MSDRKITEVEETPKSKVDNIASNIIGWCMVVLLVGFFILLVIFLLTGNPVNSFSDIFILKVLPLIGIIMILSCVALGVDEIVEKSDKND